MNGTNKGVDYGLVTLEIQGPPLMPPSLNGNGRTPPGRHGVTATWQSNVCSYALIKQHHTGTVGTDCGPDGESWPRPDGAITSMPGGVRRCHSLDASWTKDGGGWVVQEEDECGRSMLPTRKRANKHTFQLPSLLHTDSFYYSVWLSQFLRMHG